MLFCNNRCYRKGDDMAARISRENADSLFLEQHLTSYGHLAWKVVRTLCDDFPLTQVARQDVLEKARDGLRTGILTYTPAKGRRADYYYNKALLYSCIALRRERQNWVTPAPDHHVWEDAFLGVLEWHLAMLREDARQEGVDRCEDAEGYEMPLDIEERLRKDLRALDSPERQTALLYLTKQRTQAEVAAELGVTQGAVSKRLGRVKAYLAAREEARIQDKERRFDAWQRTREGGDANRKPSDLLPEDDLFTELKKHCSFFTDKELRYRQHVLDRL
jgi:RNA polymerase sigma factor (sigma-70 family)